MNADVLHLNLQWSNVLFATNRRLCCSITLAPIAHACFCCIDISLSLSLSLPPAFFHTEVLSITDMFIVQELVNISVSS
jgi:hypothetical protein